MHLSTVCHEVHKKAAPTFHQLNWVHKKATPTFHQLNWVHKKAAPTCSSSTQWEANFPVRAWDLKKQHDMTLPKAVTVHEFEGNVEQKRRLVIKDYKRKLVDCVTDCRKVHLLHNCSRRESPELLAHKALYCNFFVMNSSQMLWGLSVYCGCNMSWAAPSQVASYN